MAIVKTDSAHYSGIASALRSLHNGEEGYTPPEMAEYLATQGTELKPENIAEGVTIFGVAGTMKISAGWPDDLPVPPEDIDDAVKEVDPEAPGMDKMLLLDDKGNITVGYMYNTAVTGLYSYNGVPLLPLPDYDESTYPYAAIVVDRKDSGAIYKVTLICCEKILMSRDLSSDRSLHAYKNSNYLRYYYYESSKADGWKGGSVYTAEDDSTSSDKAEIYSMGNGESLTWANKNVYGVIWISPASNPPTFYGSTPEPAKFAFSAYNYQTTEFRAIGWLRASYHTTGEYAGQITIDDFRTTESGGWNYIKNVRWSTRDSLQYLGDEIWPQGPQRYDYNGHILPVIPEHSYEGYPYSLILLYTNSWGMDTYTVVHTNEAWYRDGSSMESPSGAGYLYYYGCNFANAYGGAMSSDYDYHQVAAFIGGKIIWANYDLKNADGSILVEASSPVEVRMPDLGT